MSTILFTLVVGFAVFGWKGMLIGGLVGLIISVIMARR